MIYLNTNASPHWSKLSKQYNKHVFEPLYYVVHSCLVTSARTKYNKDDIFCLIFQMKLVALKILHLSDYFFFVDWFYMSFQAIVAWKIVLTNWAYVLLLSFMNWFNVFFQDSLLRATVIAYWALVWFLSLMNFLNVLSQIALVWTTEITNYTLMGFRSLMNWLNMTFQMTTMWIFVITNVAFMRFNSFVNWFDMNVQISL